MSGSQSNLHENELSGDVILGAETANRAASAIDASEQAASEQELAQGRMDVEEEDPDMPRRKSLRRNEDAT